MNIKRYVPALGIAAVMTAVIAVTAAGAGNTSVTEVDTVPEELMQYAHDISEETETQAPVKETAAETEDAVQTAVSEEADDNLCVTVKADGRSEIVTLSNPSSVYDALDAAGVELGYFDTVNVDEASTVEDGAEIVVSRVEYSNDTEIEIIDYDVIYRDDESIPEGESEVLVDGREGRAVVQLRTKLVDGEEYSTEVVSRDVTIQAVDRVILRGAGTIEVEAYSAAATDTSDEGDESTTVAVVADTDGEAISLLEEPTDLSLDENGIPIDYAYIVSGKSCAYTAAPTALTSTGKTVVQGYAAVDPDAIPYGTELYIVADDGEVYGYAIAADTGYSVRAGDIVVDLFMNEYDDCIQWGAKNVTMYVLE
ncbi:MAG: G5 domain-containing protein [Oscillospiraceae bacterium]|nr:G5 domain-containing protein [Oscillospiraceae bacterium]